MATGKLRNTEPLKIDNEAILHLFEAVPGGESIEINDVAALMDLVKQDAGVEIVSDNELIQQVLEPNDSKEDHESDHNVVEATKTISHVEAESMLSKCIDWFEQQSEVDSTQLLLLRRIRVVSAKIRPKCVKTKEINRLFKQ